MKYITMAIALLSCLIIPTATNSTCIVILKTKTGIYAVADTRSEVTMLGKNQRSKRIDTIKKINNVGEYYFAIAGHDDRALQIIASGIDPKLSLLNNVKAFAERMKTHYSKSMLEEKKRAPDIYNLYLKNKLADVAFFSNNGGKPELIVVQFSMTEVKGVSNISYIIEEDLPFVALGVTDHIDKISQAEAQIYRQGDPVDILTKLVKLEMNYHKEKISCPLDVMVWEINPVLTRKYCN